MCYNTNFYCQFSDDCFNLIVEYCFSVIYIVKYPHHHKVLDFKHFTLPIMNHLFFLCYVYYSSLISINNFSQLDLILTQPLFCYSSKKLFIAPQGHFCQITIFSPILVFSKNLEAIFLWADTFEMQDLSDSVGLYVLVHWSQIITVIPHFAPCNRYTLKNPPPCLNHH